MKPIVAMLCFLATTFAASAYAAPSWWSPLPLKLRAHTSDEALDLIDRTPLRPDVFAPLWPERSHLAQMTAAFGAPNLQEDEGSSWSFESVVVRVDERPDGATWIDISHNETYAPSLPVFDPTRVALGAYVDGAKGCREGIASYGRPSSVDFHGLLFSWSTLGQGRDVSLTLFCYSLDQPGRVMISLSQAPAERLAALARPSPPATLPKHFVSSSADPTTPADPRPLWPRSLAPGQPQSTVIAAFGPPSAISTNKNGNTSAYWGGSLVVDFSPSGVVTEVGIGAHTEALQKRFGLTGPLFAAIGGPLSVLTQRLGPHSEMGARFRVAWYWDAGDHELAIEANAPRGIVTSLGFKWRPPTERADLACADALGAAPTPPMTQRAYVGLATGKLAPVLLPFGLWFGATQRDVFDRVGLPRECDASAMRYRGLTFIFEDGKLMAADVTSALLTAQLRGRRDPLVATLGAGADAIGTSFGPTHAWTHTRVFELGPERARVAISLDFDHSSTSPIYAVQLMRGFDFDGIQGLDLGDLPGSARRLGVPAIRVEGNNVGGATLKVPLAAKPELAGRVTGRFVDLLGADWTTIIAALGDPTDASATDTELVLEWRWPDDPFGRVIGYQCGGEVPTCNTLLVGSAMGSTEP